MKGLFIPEITAEMFRNGCLEGIEALMAEGEIYDIDYTGWIPCSERLPQPRDETQRRGWYLTTNEHKSVGITCYEFYGIKSKGWRSDFEILAWMPLPKPYREDGE